MSNLLTILSIATRNLLRYQRRTLLTLLLIIIGIVAVLVFVAVTGSFKNFMIGQITDSVTGHSQIHSQGYVASIDNLPLNLNIKAPAMEKIMKTINADKNVESYSTRIKFGGMLSNFTETTAVRINGVDLAKEIKTLPLLEGRLLNNKTVGSSKLSLAIDEIFIPVLLSKGLGIKVGDSIVIVATNNDGSVNGKNFVVSGVLESVTGPGGRDAYININSARELLRLDDHEVSEVVLRLKDFNNVNKWTKTIAKTLEINPSDKDFANATSAEKIKGDDKNKLEIHEWTALTPFATIARMLDLMAIFIKIMLISIVLVSVMNVMLMAVFERIREIGTMAAIGTRPNRILQLFLAEGLMLGVVGTILGTIISTITIYGLRLWAPSFNFGQQKGLILSPTITINEIITIGVLVIIVAIIASLQPAWKASRMDPNTALRHT